MPLYADCYVLVEARSRDRIELFLSHFLPQRVIGVNGWIVPNGVPPDSGTEIKDVDEVIAHCMRNPNEYQVITWRSTKDTPPRIAEVYFTDDGNMIFSLSSYEGEDEDKWLQQLKDFFDTVTGYIAYEAPPPASAKEFRRICASLD